MSAYRQERIPTSLQAVFLASNRGLDISQPPPERVAFKTFTRNWRFQAKNTTGDAGGNSLIFWKKSVATSSDGCHGNEQKPVKPVQCKTHRDTDRTVKYQPLLRPKEAEGPTKVCLSPQAHLDSMIHSRGYSTCRFKSLQTAYYNKPSQLQQTSYDIRLSEFVRQNDIDEFREIISSGISPNPCNQYGESTLHMVCRRGETAFLQAMLDAGASVQVSDDYGRTPLHDACWAAKPCFDVVKLILQRDCRLVHLTDCRGSVPLSYVPKKDWAAWLEFLDSVKDEFWPKRDVTKDGEQGTPELAMMGANTRPLCDPPNALTIELAAMVASGKMTPDEARFLVHDKTDSETNDETDPENGFSSFEVDSDLDDDDDDDDFSLDEDEMADILSSLTLPIN